MSPTTVFNTFLFTDIVDSTGLKTEIGDTEAAILISTHDNLFRNCLQIFHGTEEDDQGDGFFATFVLPSNAIKCTLEFMRGLHKANPPTLQVRCGLHMGEAAEVHEGTDQEKLLGLAVDTSARIMSVGLPGQILVSQQIVDSFLQNVRDDSVQCMSHGFYEFKGVKDPMEIFEIGIIGVSPFKAPPASNKAQPTSDKTQKSTINTSLLKHLTQLRMRKKKRKQDDQGV